MRQANPLFPHCFQLTLSTCTELIGAESSGRHIQHMQSLTLTEFFLAPMSWGLAYSVKLFSQ